MKVLLTATVQSHICQFHKPLVEILHNHNCEVHIAARDNLAEKNGLKLDFADKVFDVPFSRSPKSLDNIKAYKQISKIIKENQYDVIHCNTPMGGIITRLAANKYRKTGTKVYYTAHGFHFYNGSSKLSWLVFYPIEKFFAKYTDKLITINEEDYMCAKEKFKSDIYHIHGVGVDKSRYFPVDEEEKNQLRQIHGFQDDEKIILCIGELLPNKDQQTAIRMMKELIIDSPKSKLLLAGNGPEKDNLFSLIKQNKLENNVVMLGYCTNLETYQKMSDLVISCSQREGLGLNLIEAMLSGNPIVATTNRGHRELIEDNKNGFLIPLHDDAQLKEKIVELFANKELYDKFSVYGIEKGNLYSSDSVKKELEIIYFT